MLYALNDPLASFVFIYCIIVWKCRLKCVLRVRIKIYIYIDKPTYNSGHLLDYIVTRKDSSGVSNLYVSEFIRDHRALHVSLTCSRAHPERKQIEVRSLKRIQCDILEVDLIGVNIDRECTDVNLVVRQYDASLSPLLDKHAP